MLSKLTLIMKNSTRWLYRDLSPLELKKFSLFALIFAFTIGGYWFLAPLKDSIFMKNMCLDSSKLGGYIATGKLISTLVLFLLIPYYSLLIDKFRGHKVFYGVSGFYIIGIIIFSFFFAHESWLDAVYKFDLGWLKQLFSYDFGLQEGQFLTIEGKKIITWSWYVFIESFGAFMPVVFWSYVANHALPNEAKTGYSLIALGGVLGGFLGPLVVKKFVLHIGIVKMMIVSSIWIAMIPLLVAFTVRTLGSAGLKGYECPEKKPKPGFVEGIRLLVTNKYLVAIYLIIAINEMTQALIDVHFKTYSHAMYECKESLADFFSYYALCLNGLALICLVLRIDIIGKKIGVRRSLIALPIFVGLGIVWLYFNPTLNNAFWVIVLTKGLNYAFNQPSKEQLYIPTTPTTKYKSKAWIDVFGYQSSRALGWSAVSYQNTVDPNLFLVLSSSIGLGMVLFWILIACYAGGSYQKAIKNNDIIC
jgi:AAA family ATP:ADP antiporter